MSSVKLIVGGILAAALVAAGAVAATTGGDDDRAITGAAYERATAAALAHLGEGTVTDTEAGDEEGAYEVEITRPDGSRVDVHLDETFQVIGTEEDEPDEGES